MPTQVCITIDTEFSIAGAFTDSSLLPVSAPMVWCDVNGRSEGLGFLLERFQQAQMPATFFVETMHRNYFHDDPMKAIVGRIRADGHDVELHAHPCWTVFRNPDWRELVRREPRQDDFFGRSEDSSVALIQQGIDAFADWGAPRPQVFRSGSLQHDDALYRAMARAGIPYSSNVAMAIFDSGDPRYALYAGAHERHGVLELPVLTFADWRVGGRKHLKSLTVAGTSFSEMRTLLEQAERAGVEQVVILTHPFEYVQSRDYSLQHARRHKVNQRRLTELCSFIDSNRDRFTPCTMAAAGKRAAGRPSANPLLQGALWQSVRRMAVQVSYDQYGKWALGRSNGRRGAGPASPVL